MGLPPASAARLVDRQIRPLALAVDGEKAQGTKRMPKVRA